MVPYGAQGSAGAPHVEMFPVLAETPLVPIHAHHPRSLLFFHDLQNQNQLLKRRQRLPRLEDQRQCALLTNRGIFRLRKALLLRN